MGFDPNEPRDSNGRWGRMNSTSRAKLTASAQFKTKMSGGKQVGREPASVKGDEMIFINPTGKKGGSIGIYKYEKSKQAVAIKTSQALERDFHAARQKSDQEAMKAAMATSKVSITKLPPGKPPKYGAKGKMK